MTRNTRKCFLKVLKSQVIKLSHIKTEEIKFFKLFVFICCCILCILWRFLRIWMCESRDMTQNKTHFFLKSLEITSHKTYSSKNGCTKVSQTLKVNFVSEFGHSLNISKNLDVWESIYGPKHKEMFRKMFANHKS